MYRGLILGGIAFVAIYAAERQVEALSKDIARYNRMRAMSDQPSLLKQGIDMGLELVSSFTSSRGGDALDFFQSLQHDLMRYARISSM